MSDVAQEGRTMRPETARLVPNCGNPGHFPPPGARSERVESIREGFPADALLTVAARLRWDRDQLLRALGISPASFRRRVRLHGSLGIFDSERLLALNDLLDSTKQMVERSGTNDGFDADAWLGRWLNKPVIALGGAQPADYLDTLEGIGLLHDMLARAETGAYS